MAHPAKYDEVDHVQGRGARDIVNKKLRDGWEILTVKVLETKEGFGMPFYVLGKRRDHRTPEEIQRSKELREDMERM